MKIEHLTLGGTSLIRDTANISPEMRRIFRLIGFEYKSQNIHIPNLSFGIKITATEEGAIFDIQKNGETAIVNVCGFNSNDNTLSYVKTLASSCSKLLGRNLNVVTPVTPNWLYSIVVNPIILEREEIITSGEVELYIYEQLLKARNK